MSKDAQLQHLNKGSAKTATFLVRVMYPKKSQYEFYSKHSDRGCPRTGYKFECYLVGEKSGSYCLARVMGSPVEVDAAAQKFKDGTAWRLSKVGLDGKAEMAFLNPPIKLRVELNKTTVQPLLHS